MPHAFTFTLSAPLFVECEGEEEINRLAKAIAEGGTVMAPLYNNGFSRRSFRRLMAVESRIMGA